MATVSPGPHVFGANRVGIWAIENTGLADKLKHILPRARHLIPNLTDVFLPLNATQEARIQVRLNDMNAHLYCVAHSTPPVELAKAAKAARSRLGTGAIEVDLEGPAVQPDLPALANYQRAFVAEIRRTNPNLAIRLNVPPFKGYALDVEQIVADPQLYVIAQAYYGNMDGRNSEADVWDNLVGPEGVGYGVPREKASLQYAVMANLPRTFVLPGHAYKPITKGSVYSDDLLLDSGRLPA